jgi:predicted DNA-binding helix-hairpin-helix protein
MEALTQLKINSTYMDLESAEDTGCPQVSSIADKSYITNATLPNGKKIPLLKTLLTSACERNCFYCPFRAGRDFRRATFKPEGLADIYLALHRAGIAEGIFLSSGIIGGGARTQDLLLDTADILRHKLNYRGYLHLKIMPGAERDQVERSMQLADRISVNLEAPNTKRLNKLAPRKQFLDELIQPLRWIEEIRRTRPSHMGWNNHWPSSVTQFVVGAVGESDLELLKTTAQLYGQLQLRRAYFSRFNPIPDTPLEHQTGETVNRQHRLYQASFLLRDYNFSLEELPLDQAGNLPQHTDPKLAWAKLHLAERPVEINQADRFMLLRIPGIGPKSARAIINRRRQGRLLYLSELGKLGINTNRVAPFILVNGVRPSFQASLW